MMEIGSKGLFTANSKVKQGTHSNCIFKFHVFPVHSLSDTKFSVPIHVICDYYIHKTNLAELSSLKKNRKFLGQI